MEYIMIDTLKMFDNGRSGNKPTATKCVDCAKKDREEGFVCTRRPNSQIQKKPRRGRGGAHVRGRSVG